MTRYEILSFLELGDAVAEDIAKHFSIPRSYVYSRLTVLNRQGLITKKKGEDGVLHFGLTNWGKEKLEWLGEQDEEDLENKLLRGDKKMPRTRYIEDGLYMCPECENEYELEDVLEGSPESLCPDCGVELELIDDGEEESEPVRRGR